MDLVKMQVPEGCGGCSHGGEWFSAIEGFCHVPVSAISVLIRNHGWTKFEEAIQVAEADVKEEIAVVEGKVKKIVKAVEDDVGDLV